MTAEQKKIAVVAAVGGSGLLLLLYLLKSRGAAGGVVPGVQSGVSPLQLPPGSDITYNFPGVAPPPATVAVPAPSSCTKVCDTCDDNSAFAAVASYKISPGVIAAGARSVAPFVPTTQPYDIYSPIFDAYATQAEFYNFGR